MVGILRVDQAWGSAQLAVAAHEIRAGNLVGVNALGNTVAVLPGGCGLVSPISTPSTTSGATRSRAA